MKRRFRVTKELVDKLADYEYDEMLKLAAVLKMLEEDGLTSEMIQKWGKRYKGRDYLEITLCKKNRAYTFSGATGYSINPKKVEKIFRQA